MLLVRFVLLENRLVLWVVDEDVSRGDFPEFLRKVVHVVDDVNCVSERLRDLHLIII